MVPAPEPTGPGSGRGRHIGLLLAAGRSTRFGAPKQLAPLAGKPLLAHAVDRLSASRLDGVILVLGHRYDAIRRALGPLPARVHWVFNPVYGRGLASSLRRGLAFVGADCDAILVALGDQPLVPVTVVDTLLAARRESGAPVVVPTCRGAWGNPVLLGRETFPHLARLKGDAGAKRLVQERYGKTLLALPVEDDAILVDVDTPAAFDAVRRRCEG